MPPSRHLLAAFALLASPLAAARAGTPPAYQPMRIDQSWEPNFPAQATQLDLTSGDATVAVSIDASGRLTDLLVVAYSHPAFAETAVFALRKWKYQPARLDGRPLAVTKEVAFHFEEHGLILVNLTATELIEAQMREVKPLATSYRAYALNEIDRALRPTSIVSPVYPEDLREKGISGAVDVEYYINEDGRVRMPVVTNPAAPELAGLAVEAVQQWQFDPPTRHGKPVLVHVSQQIRFNPKK